MADEKMICETYTTESAEKAFAFNAEVKGHATYLDDGRIIFIGKHPGHQGEWFLGFRNLEGYETKLRLSYEAMAHLVKLYNRKPNGEEIFPMTIKTAWQVTVINEPEDAA